MNVRLNKLGILGVFAVMTALPRPADAANNSISNAWIGVYGQVRAQTLDAAGSGTDVGYYRFAVQANRSYAAICWFIGVDGGGTNTTIVRWRTAADADLGSAGDIEPFDPSFIGDIAVIQPTSAGSLYVRINNPNASVVTANLMVMETTLFSPWFFVSTAPYEAYVEIRNNTASSISVTLRAYNSGGTIIGSTTIALPGNGNTALGMSTLGIMDTGGSVSLTHNGPPGALVANITTLGTATGVSFDAPFAPRMIWSTFQQ